MAKSKAKKQREKMEREGKLNPDLKRSPFVFVYMRTRTTQTKKDCLYKNKYKNHYSTEGRDGSFYFTVKWTYFYGITSIIEQFVLQYFGFKLI
ncbi:hypothetical protein ABE288_19235 [Bacillus salipaludis]|uniref:hypothetical protein n=1 Tax=Bacillus salipaludis TaxID=2547811 RepID=UPI003D1DDD05